MRRLIYIPALLYCFFAAGSTLAATPAEKVQETYAAIDSLRSEFSQVLLHKESGAEEHRSGVLEFKRPLLVCWATQKPSPELLVVGKKEIWNVFDDERSAYKYPLSMADDSRSIVRVVTGQASLTQNYDVESKGKENGLLKLDIYPHEPTQSMTEGTLWIDEVSGLIKRVRIVDFYGNTNDITLSNIELGVHLPDKTFTYTPPQNYTVEDRTKDESPAKPLMR